MSQSKNNAAVAGSLLFSVFLWGGNNAGTKWLVMTWPPIWTGCIRFLLAGALLLAVLRYTSWLGGYRTPSSNLRRQLWLRGGLVLSVYIIAFNWALRLTSASHVALYLGASPVWALLWEERPERSWMSLKRYGAALLAVCGVLVLLWPALRAAKPNLPGEFLGLAASVLWATFSHQIRLLSGQLSGTEVAAHTMWMSGILLLPFGLVEIALRGLPVNPASLGVMGFCVICGGVIPYALWNDALHRWRTSRVMLFNNLIPLSTMSWAYFLLGEPVTPTFWAAMILIVAGVIIGQSNWLKMPETPESF
ncbi:MAG TPA: DMT family transporter [Candidatus Saccharimonadales bacterium]|nr:DMT family transporter [Candidatus Saccharimonadales bacterium]